MTRPKFQSRARADLVDIWLHIADDSVSAADAYIDRIREVCDLLAENPSIGIDRADVGPGLRSLAVDSHVIYYERTDGGITVLRTWHGARDPQAFRAL